MRTMLTLALALLLASPAIALAKGEKKPAPCPAKQAIDQMTKNLTLTAEQKTKLDGIAKEMGPKMMDAMKAGDVLTKEQKKAGHDAAKAAKAEGKKGKELKQAADEAIKATPEQKSKMDDSAKQLKGLQKDLREKVMSVLTPEQRDQLKPKKGKKAEKTTSIEKQADKTSECKTSECKSGACKSGACKSGECKPCDKAASTEKQADK